jgi:hypothetical protein
MTKAERYAEQCKPLPPVAGESLEDRVDRLDRSLDYLTQCFQDEFEVRDEGTLLVDVITRVLLPFAALSTAASLLYVRLVEWSTVHFPSFERVAAVTYLGLLLLILAVLLSARQSGRFRRVNSMIDKTGARFTASVPIRKETLTRNNVVNRWIYIWVAGAFTLFIPLTFIALRSGVADDLGVRLVVDTANVCDGPGRVHIFTGSQTCVEIQEDNAPEPGDTNIQNATGGEAGGARLGNVEVADTALEAHVAEIRLDTTTTLALAVIVLIGGILAGMALWWWRNRRVRKIDLL